MYEKFGLRAKKVNLVSAHLRHLVFILFLGFSLGAATLPQPAQAQTYQFSSFSVEGNQRVDTATVLTFAGISAGRSISAAALNAGYQDVLATGLFESVEFIPQGGRLLIRVVEYPTINRISVEGNRRLNDDAALAIITSKPRLVFSPTQIQSDAAALTEAYELQGRLSATVNPKVILRNGNRVDVVFEVKEGRIVEIERLSFVGNREFSDRRLRGVLETKQAGALRVIIGQDTFVEDRIEFDKQLLRDFYQARGYVDYQTLSVASEFSRERNAFFVTFNIREGQQFTFGKTSTVSEIDEVDPAEFNDVIKIRPGQTYSPELVDNIISRMESIALLNGLNLLRVEPRVTRNDRDLSLDIEFALVRGPRIFVERIDIEGNATTVDRVIRRQFRVVEGDPFNPREIREAAARIRALGLFANSDVNARQGSAEDQVIVDVDVEETPTGSLTFGASYNFSTGIGLTASFSERNFLGRGQTLNFNLNLGTDNRRLGFTFVEPALLGRDLRFRFEGDYSRTEYDYTDYDTQSFLFKPSVEFRVGENSRLALRYTLSTDKIFNVSSSSSGVLNAEEAEGNVVTSALGYFVSYDTRRSGLNPNAGVLLQFGQDFAGVGGDSKYIKSTARASVQGKIFNDDVTVRATLEGGAINMISGNSRITDRFILDNEILRGFDPAGVGPRDLTVANQDALGGNYYAVARFETDFPLGLPEEYGINGGIFVDVGSVWGLDNTNGGAVDDDFYLRSTAGLSLFWRTPIGPLRFNFMKNLKKESYDNDQSFDLTISTQF